NAQAESCSCWARGSSREVTSRRGACIAARPSRKLLLDDWTWVQGWDRMEAQLANWDDLRLFLAVARAGTLSGAARALGVNHSTVFRRVGAFEEALEVRLFE